MGKPKITFHVESRRVDTQGRLAGCTSVEIALGFCLLAYLAGAYDVAREAIPALFRRMIDIDFLMIAAAAGAALLGEWPEAK